MDASDSLVGARIERREDPSLLTGRAEYTDDLSAPGMAYLSILRSQYGHARIEGIEAGAAEEADGVLGVFTAADIRASGGSGAIPMTASEVDPGVEEHPLLAEGRVRYQGQPIAAVVAEDRYAARDAVDAIEVDYERLDAVSDPSEAAGGDAPTIHEAAPDNVAADWEVGDAEATDAAFGDAEHVVGVDLVNNRLIPNAIEPRAALARYDPAGGEMFVELAGQKPHRRRGGLSETLGIPESKIRVRAPDVGGGFGHKGHHYPGEALAAWCAMRLDRPVKWTATRSENYLAGAHARHHVTRAEIALDGDGMIEGIRIDTDATVGAYVLGGSTRAAMYRHGDLLSSQYEIPAIHCRARAAFTNTAPIHSYRGAGRPEAIYVVERLVDAAARELGVDPVELRRRNQIQPDAFPHETAVGTVYDSGDYEKALDLALETVGYDELCERRDELREEGRYLGIGIACYVESTGSGPFENGIVRVHPSGSVTVAAGTHSHGQGHGTTFAQIVADEMGVPYDEIEVIEGDTDQTPMGRGTSGSRSVAVGGSAIAQSARRVVEKARRIAADRLEAATEDVALEAGEFRVEGAPQRSMSWGEVASAAYAGGLTDGMEPGLDVTSFYEIEDETYAFGTHVAVVEVDPDTGEIEFERYVAVDDCGVQINPKLVEGQVHGGVAQGVGQALYENAEYDGSGNLVTGSLQDYAVPKAFHVPEIETEETVTPCPHNPLGAKGIGEGGTIVAPPAVVNAVVDALEPLGVEHVDMPLSSERVWRAIEDAGE